MLYETPTQYAQQGTNSQQADNERRRQRYEANASQGIYPYAQQGSEVAQATGAASQGATQQHASDQRPQTFAQMQQAGYARPAPPGAATPPPPSLPPGANPSTPPPQSPPPPSYQPSYPSFQPAAASPSSGGLAPDIQRQIVSLLADPTQGASAGYRELYARGAQDIDDDFRGREQAVNEEMARRGLFASTIGAGRLYDTNIGRRSAMSDLNSRLAIAEAQGRAGALNSALGTAIDFQRSRDDVDARAASQRASEALMAYNAARDADDLRYRYSELGQRGAQFDRELAQRGREGDRNYDLDNRRLGQQGSQFDRELGLRERQFGADDSYRRERAGRSDLEFDRRLEYDRGRDQDELDYRYTQSFNPTGLEYYDPEYSPPPSPELYYDEPGLPTLPPLPPPEVYYGEAAPPYNPALEERGPARLLY